VKLLRDLREATRLLILLEVTTQKPRTLKPLAEKLEMTIQGVSEYLKGMSEEGLILKGAEGYRATKKGVKFLHDNLRSLREFVEASAKEMRFVDVATALAGGDIRRGEEVGLFMEGGYLLAYPRRASASKGRALRDARRGEDVTVTDLQGLVALRPGSVTLVALPPRSEGGRLVVDRDSALVAVGDPVARAWATALGWKVDLEFAPIQGTIDAAIRGLDVVFLSSREGVHEVITAIEAVNSGLEDRISYRVVKPR
jgi:putative transcriptional regulator